MTPKEKNKKIKELRFQLNNLGLSIVKVDPTVPITLGDGHEYMLEYSYAAALDILRLTGKNINLLEVSVNDVLGVSINRDAKGTVSVVTDPTIFPQFLFAGLQTHHDGAFTSVEDLTHVIMLRHMTYYATCISLAMEALQPEQEEVERLTDELRETTKEEPEIPLAMTGTSSSSGLNVEILDVPISISGE